MYDDKILGIHICNNLCYGFGTQRDELLPCAKDWLHTIADFLFIYKFHKIV